MAARNAAWYTAGMNRKALPALVLCAILCSCVGVVPMRQRTVTQQGASARIDLSFLKAGSTSRPDVLNQLKATDTGVESSHFFVGRWRASNWAEWIAIGTPAGYGGVGGDRIWKNANLLVTFDANGAVEGYEIFPDKQLILKLAPLARERKLSENEQVEVSTVLGNSDIATNLVLRLDSMEIVETERVRAFKKRPQYHYTVPAHNLKGVSLARFQNNVTYLDVKFHFIEDLRQFQGPPGKTISLQMAMPQLVTVLAYAELHTTTPHSQP